MGMICDVSFTHRIALISDLHGNAIALREVLRSIRRHGVDEVICLGDVATLGVAPCEVIDTLQQLGCRCVLGNHDEYIFHPSLVRDYTDDGVVIDSIEWCRDVLPADAVEFLRGFEEGFEVPLGRDATLKLFHGSPGSNMVDLLAETDPRTFDGQLGPERATVMAGGHTHIQMIRQHRGTLVVNPGSVGAPFKESIYAGPITVLPHAEYAVVSADEADVAVTLHRVGLDRSELEKAARDTASPIGAMLLEEYARDV